MKGGLQLKVADVVVAVSAVGVKVGEDVFDPAVAGDLELLTGVHGQLPLLGERGEQSIAAT